MKEYQQETHFTKELSHSGVREIFANKGVPLLTEYIWLQE